MSTQPSPTAPRRLVVGVDGSAASVEALRWAARTGGALGLALEAVSSWDFPASYGLAGGIGGWDPAADAKVEQEGALSTAFGHEYPAGLTRRTQQGQPARVLIEAAAGAELLVVGSRGHGGFAGLLLGSVSTQCAAHAPCPVVVVHEAEPGAS